MALWESEADCNRNPKRCETGDNRMPEEGKGLYRVSGGIGKILVVCLFVLSIMCLLEDSSRAEMVIAPIQFRSAEEVFPMVQDLLSPEGRASLDLRTNRIVIIDNPESLKKYRPS